MSHADLSPYHGKRIVVLGPAGFIGRWVARLLTESGAELHLLVRNLEAAKHIFTRFGVRGQIHTIDLRDFATLDHLLHQIKPNLAFNLAGYGVDPNQRDERLAYQLNAELIANIAGIMADLQNHEWDGQSIVHTGSALEYGQIGNDLSEDSLPHPTTLYGKSKLAGTQALSRCCRQYGVRGVTARLFSVYGPGERPGRLLPALIQTARQGGMLGLTAGDQKRDFVFVEDVARGLLRLGLSCSKPGETVNLATGNLIEVREFIKTAARQLDIPAQNLNFGAIPTRWKEMEHLPVSIRRLMELVSWKPTTGIETGIHRTILFYDSLNLGD
jgi:UDP-glucose 4-epimerase